METKPCLRDVKYSDLRITAKRTLELISLDLNGPLPRSQGHTMILSIVDISTKFLISYALKTATTNEVINEVNKLQEYI